MLEERKEIDMPLKIAVFFFALMMASVAHAQKIDLLCTNNGGQGREDAVTFDPSAMTLTWAQSPDAPLRVKTARKTRTGYILQMTRVRTTEMTVYINGKDSYLDIRDGKHREKDPCRLTIHRSATGATIAENNCASGHGLSCSFDTRGQTLRRVEPLETQEESKPETRQTGVAQRKADEPLDIVQRMYRDVLSNSRDPIESSKNNSRYFVPALARLITDCFNTSDCLLEIEFSGNGGPDTDQMRRTLSLEQLSNDGAHAVIRAKSFGYGKEETRRFEFTKAGNAWKISDVVYPDGHRLSNLKR